MRQTTSNGSLGTDFHETVKSISVIVRALVSTSDGSLKKPAFEAYQDTGYAILADLSHANEQLESLGDQMRNVTMINKARKQQLASSSYEIAKVICSVRQGNSYFISSLSRS